MTSRLFSLILLAHSLVGVFAYDVLSLYFIRSDNLLVQDLKVGDGGVLAMENSHYLNVTESFRNTGTILFKGKRGLDASEFGDGRPVVQIHTRNIFKNGGTIEVDYIDTVVPAKLLISSDMSLVNFGMIVLSSRGNWRRRFKHSLVTDKSTEMYDMVLSADGMIINAGTIMVLGKKHHLVMLDVRFKDVSDHNSVLNNYGTICFLYAAWRQTVPLRGHGCIVIGEMGLVQLSDRYGDITPVVHLFLGILVAAFLLTITSTSSMTTVPLTGFSRNSVIHFDPPLLALDVQGPDLVFECKGGHTCLTLALPLGYNPKAFMFTGGTLTYHDDIETKMPEQCRCPRKL